MRPADRQRLCTGRDPVLWETPCRNSTNTAEGAQRAMALCARCPGQSTCEPADGDRRGLIVAGVPHNATGQPLRQCAWRGCGRWIWRTGYRGCCTALHRQRADAELELVAA